MTSTDQVEDGAAAVERLAHSYGERAAARDVEAFLELYADEVVINDLFSVDPLVGKAAWREQVIGWFGDVKEGERNVAAIEPLTVLVGGDLAVAHGRVRYGVLNPDGGERYGMWNRLTWVVRPGEDGVWRIVHEHTSVSLDPATMAPVLG